MLTYLNCIRGFELFKQDGIVKFHENKKLKRANKMNYDGYLGWKRWDKKTFGVVTPGSRFSFHQTFKHGLKKKSRILEIGFGNGELLTYFHTQGHQVVGVEINSTLVDRANNFGYEAYSGAVWDIAELQSESFDLIVAFSVVEHLTHDELNAFFLWARERLNDSGAMCLKFPEGASPFGLGYQNGDFTHVSCLTKSKIELLCNVNNLDLKSYDDELIVSNKLCSFGFLGKVVLVIMQWYAKWLKLAIRIFLFPVSTSLRLGTNSIAIITPTKVSNDQ